MALNGKSARNLINQLFRRERWVRTNARPLSKNAALDTYDTIFENPKDIDLSNGLERALRNYIRRLQRAFSVANPAHKPALQTKQLASLARVVYAPSPSGHAIQVTLPADVIEYEGLYIGDIAIFLNGQLKGQNLAILAILSPTTLVVEDYASYTGTESSISIRFYLNGVKRSYV